jgi:hypothetical protein
MLMLGAIGAAGVVSAAPANASTPVGAVFEHQNFGGARHRYNVSEDGYVCTLSADDVDVQWTTMASGWDNRVSSFKGYSDCWTKLYDLWSFGGVSYPFSGDTTSLGIFDNKANSIQYT